MSNTEESDSDEEMYQSSDDSSGAEFEPIDVSSARMKSLSGQWLVKAFEHIKSHPDILINGFKAAGITDALGIAVKLTDALLEYPSETDSEIDDDELLHGSSSMRVDNVYGTDADSDTVNTIVISDKGGAT